MSVQTLYTAATGMEALETKLDVIANNLANVNTTGFKALRGNFEDLLYLEEPPPGAENSLGNYTAVGTQIGLGARVSSTQANFQEGPLKNTGGPLDVAIVGRGFFQVQDTDGTIVYSRAGNFSVNANGQLVMGSATNGRLIEPNITIPPGSTDIAISGDGIVSVRLNGEQQQVGQLELATFVNPEGLLRLGDNLYTKTESSGPEQTGNPTDSSLGLGSVQQFFLETSNVEPVREMIDLITTQRAFELNSQAIQAGDQIMQLVNNLRRF